MVYKRLRASRAKRVRFKRARFGSSRPMKRRRVMTKLRWKSRSIMRRGRYPRYKNVGGVLRKSRIVYSTFRDVYKVSTAADAVIHALTHGYRANSVHLPYAGGSEDASGHQFMSKLYANYVVLGSSISFLIRNTSSSTDVPLRVFIKRDNTASMTIGGGITWIQWDNDPNVVGGNYYSYDDGKGRLRLKHTFSPYKFFALKDVVDNTDDVGAAVGSAPSKLCYFVPYYQSLDTSTVGSERSHLVNVIIRYKVLYFNPNDVTSAMEAGDEMEQV